MHAHTHTHLGETDWKILAIDVTDPLAEKLNGESLILLQVDF